mmetsp:Transcript_102710/g.329248  ORF Transcript_102710/g.329248 Transcript_102710/m.329248 type:complete len:743 (-) Transcript_102710:33-2261(-)
MRPDRCLHVCLLGDPGSGLSAFLRSYRGPEGGPDAAIESMVMEVEIEGEPWKVRFTDNVGLPCFDTLRSAALSSAHVVLLCFASDSEFSLLHLKERYGPMHWSTGSEAPTFVVGLKSDLRGAQGHQCVEEDVCFEAADRLGALAYLECSAVWPESVQRVMEEALATAKDYYAVQWQLCPDPSFAAPDRLTTAAHPRESEEQQFWLDHERQNISDDPRPVDQDTVRQSLSMLGRTSNRQTAYLRSDLSGLGLTSIDALRPFQHLQFVNVSRNQLRTLEPLGALRCMLHLNASHNGLIRTQCFTAPDFLETADLSYNMIGDLGDWGVHKYLRELNLRGNFISRIGPGLLNNKELKVLDLSENHISNIENLDGLKLQELQLAQNQLSSLKGVAALQKLQSLDVRHNVITSIAALQAEDMPRLRKLCISDNRITQIAEVAGLESFPFLCELLLAPSPVVELPYYRSQVLHRLPRLRSLDAEPVPAEEKVKAEIIYGCDAEARQQIFDELLPKESFVDRRLVTEEQIAAHEVDTFGQEGDAGPYGGANPAGGAGGPAGERSRLQEAKLRQRLAVARGGGEPAGTGDFENFAAPFASIVVGDEDLPAILEAALEGDVERLILGPSKLSVRSIREIVSVLATAPGCLRHVEITDCQFIGELEKELVNSFPYARGCSMEAPDCGLSAAGSEKLQNQTEQALDALKRQAEQRKRSADLTQECISKQEERDLRLGLTVFSFSGCVVCACSSF